MADCSEESSHRTHCYSIAQNGINTDLEYNFRKIPKIAYNGHLRYRFTLSGVLSGIKYTVGLLIFLITTLCQLPSCDVVRS